jgi:hypothetical protein
MTVWEYQASMRPTERPIPEVAAGLILLPTSSFPAPDQGRPVWPSGGLGFICRPFGYSVAADPNGCQWIPQGHHGPSGGL